MMPTIEPPTREKPTVEPGINPDKVIIPDTLPPLSDPFWNPVREKPSPSGPEAEPSPDGPGKGKPPKDKPKTDQE